MKGRKYEMKYLMKLNNVDFDDTVRSVINLVARKLGLFVLIHKTLFFNCYLMFLLKDFLNLHILLLIIVIIINKSRYKAPDICSLLAFLT